MHNLVIIILSVSCLSDDREPEILILLLRYGELSTEIRFGVQDLNPVSKLFSERPTLPGGNMKETGLSGVKVKRYVLFSLRNLQIGCKHTVSCFRAFVETTDAVALLGRKVSLETVFSRSFINVVNLAAPCQKWEAENIKGLLKRLIATLIFHTLLLQGPDSQIKLIRVKYWDNMCESLTEKCFEINVTQSAWSFPTLLVLLNCTTVMVVVQCYRRIFSLPYTSMDACTMDKFKHIFIL